MGGALALRGGIREWRFEGAEVRSLSWVNQLVTDEVPVESHLGSSRLKEIEEG